jgi:hypothetical protein
MEEKMRPVGIDRGDRIEVRLLLDGCGHGGVNGRKMASARPPRSASHRAGCANPAKGAPPGTACHRLAERSSKARLPADSASPRNTYPEGQCGIDARRCARGSSLGGGGPFGEPAVRGPRDSCPAGGRGGSHQTTMILLHDMKRPGAGGPGPPDLEPSAPSLSSTPALRSFPLDRHHGRASVPTMNHLPGIPYFPVGFFLVHRPVGEQGAIPTGR